MNIPSRYINLLITLVLLLSACQTTRHTPHLTEHLFFRTGRINITHPGEQAGTTGARVLAEQVTYSLPQEEEEHAQTQEQVQSLDTNKVYAIPQVTVLSKARFAPVREGHVNIDFVIRVPKEYLSDNYQICLTPELMHNDSLVTLQDVILRGTNFIAMQEKDYEKYDKYLSEIIDPAGYDTAFINRRAITRELDKIRKNEINTYYNRWIAVQEYEQWRVHQLDKYDLYNIKQGGKLRERLKKHDMDYQRSLNRMLAAGQDTTTMAQQYRNKRQQMIENSPAQRQITLATVPTKFREIYRSGLRAQDIEPLMPQEKDSIQIAAEHVMHEKIAFNEIKGSRREETFNRMVPYPYRHDVQYSAQITPDREFVYRYTKEYPVTPGLKNLRLTLKGYVTATDRSYYAIRRSDTLTYLISSLDELADGSLIAQKDFTQIQQREYAQAIMLLQARQYQQAIGILNRYKDYNTAVALTCMGYDKQAYNLVVQLKENANTNYLAAILCCRIQEENKAINHLKKAIKMDNQKIYRIGKDPEISNLVRRYGLQKELDKITEEDTI